MSADHVVIIGAGEAGARVAHELTQRGWTGGITLVGAEDHPVYERPPLSKAMLLDPDPKAVEPYRERSLAEHGVTVLQGRSARSLDTDARQVALDDGRALTYSHLVLATGARSRRLPDLPGEVLSLRTLEESLQLRAALGAADRLLVVGAGLIGLEVAAAARAKGVDITVVESGERALARSVPTGVAEQVAERHRREGVDLRLSTTLTSIGRRGEAWQVALSDGSEVTVDLVVQAVGSVPETSLAETAGMLVDDGIIVDGRMRTSADGVWAVGDCTSGPIALTGERRRVESWRMAHDQAVVAAADIAGEPVAHDAIPWLWSDQYDLTIQVSGLLDAATQWLVRPEPDGTEVHLALDPDGRLVCAAGVGRAAIAKDVRKAERIMRAGTPVDPAVLVDPTIPLRP